MVYITEIPKDRLTAILVADLTPAQLDTIQEQFGIGALSSYELFIHDRREWSSRSLADLKRAYPDVEPLIVIDSRTPKDGGVWYLERFADEDEVEDDLAENTNTLFKIRINIPDLQISHANYDVANISIDEDLYGVGISSDHGIPENFDQEVLHSTDIDYAEEKRSLESERVIATLDELESTTDLNDLKTCAASDVGWRLKEEVAKQYGLKSEWAAASDVTEIDLPDGAKKRFPEGSKSLICTYAPEAIPKYERPEGSL